MPSTNKNKVHKHNENSFYNNQEIYKDKTFLAFVIDGEVVQTMLSDDRFSAILQSNPEIIEVPVETDPSFNGPHIGWIFDGKEFKHPRLVP
jgi:hypothetical protein